MKQRKRIISFLLLLSLLLTSTTFAYWASEVEGTSLEATSTLGVGSGKTIRTRFDLTNEFNSGGYLVPKSQIGNSFEGAVDSVHLLYDIAWVEDNDTTQLEGTKTKGILNIEHQLIIEQDGKVLNEDIYSNIYELINVEYDQNNPTVLFLNSESETVKFTVTMSEPKDQKEYDLIHNSKISVVIDYTVLTNNIETTDQVTEVETEPVVIIETNAEFFKSASFKIKKYDTEGGLDIVIPQVIKGKEITELSQNSFYNLGLTSVIIQDGITVIKGNAFYSNHLTTITIPSTVEEILHNAFNNNALTEVVFEEGLETIEAGAFANNSITEVSIPSTVSFIGSGAFGYGENFITSITIGEDVTIESGTSFGWYGSAFKSLYDLEKQAGTYTYIEGEWVLN